MNASEKVTINTGIHYFRGAVTVGLSLYAVRLTLAALGAYDYGIFNLIAGMISIFAFLNSAMTQSTQRFLAFYQGRQNIQMQKKVFSNSLLLHLIIGVLVVTLLECAGFFLINHFLNIPVSRLHVAGKVYQCMCFAVFFSIILMPFVSLLTAHENMLGIAVINTAEIILKLIAAALLFVTSRDRLMMFGVFTAAVSFLVFTITAIYCMKRYTDCRISNPRHTDLPMMKELMAFAGWNLFGALCSVARYEGLAILLNLFFGTVVNASFAISMQVAAQLNFLPINMLRSINPQITKSEGAGDRRRMIRLSLTASKVGFFLMGLLAIPCIFEMPAILAIWLKDIPANTGLFCCLMLIAAQINQFTIGIQAALQAAGKIRIYQSLVGTLLLLNIPIAYFLLKTGSPPYGVLVSYACIEVVACCTRFYLARKAFCLSASRFFFSVIRREVMPVVASITVCFLITHYSVISHRFILTFGCSTFIFLITVYYTGLDTEERRVIDRIFITFRSKLYGYILGSKNY